MTTDYSKLSDIELTNELKRLTRDLKKVQSTRISDPKLPEHFVKQAEVEAQMDEIKAQQSQLGELLLERDKQRQKRSDQRLDKLAETGAEAAEKLLEKLPQFSHQISLAFDVLAPEYAEILELSKTVRKTNMTLLGSNRPQCVPASLKIEPNNLAKLLKEQIRAAFGPDTANVFLPQQSPGFDIKTAVDDIVQECTGEAKEATHV